MYIAYPLNDFGLKTKSEFTLQAAEYLLRERQYANSSVHCSYYSCLQHMLYIIAMKVGRAESEQLYTDDGSHKYAEKTIKEELLYKRGQVKLKEPRDIETFSTLFIELKKLRVLADYKPALTEPDTARAAYNKAQSLLNLLRRNFS